MMGTDIHAAIEYYDGQRWTAMLVPNRWAGHDFGESELEPALTSSLDFGRNYDAFAILANVRNGRGFAGIVTGEGFNVLSDQRGLPDDITDEGREACSGDHSDTFVTLNDMLAFDWTQVTTHYGVVDAVTFEEWDRMKQWQPRPSSWCGSVDGAGIVHVSTEQMRAAIKQVMAHGTHYASSIEKLKQKYDGWHTRISWVEPYTQSAGELWNRWFPLMLKLGQTYKQVRMVMNFDS